MKPTASPRAQALAILDSLPDSAMILVGWSFGPERPCTRAEARALIMNGSFTAKQMEMSAALFAQAEADVSENEALKRRRSMKVVQQAGTAGRAHS